MPPAGHTLVIECASEACSAALFEGERLLDSRYEVLGRGHAERLVPMIAELPARGAADRILVSLGPGSFTGVRIGIAAARALGLAWKVPVLGYPTLALVAGMARDGAAEPVTACMNGGHGEWFVQSFDAGGMPETEATSLMPERAVALGHHPVIAGNRAGELAALSSDPSVSVVNVLPDAARAAALPDALFRRDLIPIYGRAPDATPQRPVRC